MIKLWGMGTAFALFALRDILTSKKGLSCVAASFAIVAGIGYAGAKISDHFNADSLVKTTALISPGRQQLLEQNLAGNPESFQTAMNEAAKIAADKYFADHKAPCDPGKAGKTPGDTLARAQCLTPGK